MKDLRLLEFAVSLGRHRNFAQAAQSLRVTQPTLSRGIATLEKSLGARLFDRTTRRVAPTSVGQAFLERAEMLLRESAQLRDWVSSQEGSYVGQLTIGSGPYPLEFSVLPAVARLIVQHPKLRIRVVESSWRELPAMLVRGDLDIAVVEGSVLADDDRVQVELLPPRRGVLVCRAGHPLLRQARVSPQDLKSYPLVGITMTRAVRARIGAIVSLGQVDRLTGDVAPVVATSSLCAMREVVRRTDGVAICPPSEVREDVRAGRLAILEADFDLPSTGYGMVTLRRRNLSLATRAFMEVMREIEAQSAQGDGHVAARRPVRRARQRT